MSARHTGPVLAAVLLLAACGAARTGTSDSVTREGNAFILAGADLVESRGSLLSTMQGRIPNLRLRRQSGECPEISLRSHSSALSPVNPHVYVDGTRTADTCILESLRGEDVERVEVYPQGVTNRPGYATHAHGLILVFMRGGRTP
ncbi:MAG TPA: hypothetical protein VK936_07305 [Longimicrobiales bacterium]|nr:hypothetical protein [Longimicrobiales bacterium]